VLLYDLLLKGAEIRSDRPALIFHEQTVTYGQLCDETSRLASALRERGVGPGDRVAVLLPNCPQFTSAYYATVALGAVCVPANPALKAAELTHIWRDSAVKLAIVAPTTLEHAFGAQKGVETLTTLVSTGARADTPTELPTFDELLASGRPGPVEALGIREEDPAVCIYTSGTTGRPKGALLSHRNLLVNSRQVRDALRFQETDNFLCVLPLFHSFAGTVCQNVPLFCGARTTILELFNPTRVLEAIARHQVTVLPGVPAMYGALLQLPDDRGFDIKSLRLCVSGGAPMPLAIMKAFEQRFGGIILEGDGPTECSPVTSVNPLEGERKLGSIGLPIPDVEMKIFDDKDTEVADDEVGEIVVRGENVMLGYHNQPEATAEAMRSGWYHTGDLGHRDADGYFYIVDRKKDMIIVGGINVYPREIEEVLYQHPAVLDAAVLGAADALRGESVLAVVVLKPGAQATATDLVTHCRQQLANFKVPRKVLFRESLPRSGTGKVLKRLLRKELDLDPA
jgi:long-chain acyl-CoA synthetase